MVSMATPGPGLTVTFPIAIYLVYGYVTIDVRGKPRNKPSGTPALFL